VNPGFGAHIHTITNSIATKENSGKPMKNTRRDHLILLGIILAGLIIRLTFLTIIAKYPERGLSPDSQSYLKPATSLVSSGVYPPDNGKRPPVYPLFIALIYFLGGQNLVLIMTAQILLDIITIYLTYVLASSFFPKPVALIGALIMAINIDSITYDYYYLSETLSTFFTIAGLLTWVKGTREGWPGWFMLGAFFMGLSVLTRPIALYLPIVLMLWLSVMRERPLRERLFHAGAYAVTFLLVLWPWIIRNHNVTGLATVSTISHYNLLYFNAVSLEAEVRDVGEGQVRREFLALQDQKLEELGLEKTPGNAARVQSMLGREIILSNPVLYIYVHLKSDLNSLLPDTNILELVGITSGGKGTLGILREKGLMAAIQHYFGDQTWLIGLLLPAIVLLGFIYATGLIGFIQIIRERNWLPFLVLVITSAYFLILPGAPSIARFRVPIMPYLSILSGFGTYAMYQWLMQKRRGKKERLRSSAGQETEKMTLTQTR
jgi:4-amino-4-deoxy-L-arabinose transferase-like glycosyltransferase